MPHIAVGAASAIAAAAPSGAIAVASTAAATTAAKVGIMATLKSIAFKAAANIAITAAMSAMQPQVGAAGRPMDWTLDPDGPIPFAAGRVGVAGAVVHKRTFGPDLMYYGFVSVLSGAGPIDGYESFRGDDEFVTFDGSGKAVSSQWRDEMWMRQSHGWQPDLAITSPPGLKDNAALPDWSSDHKLSGKAGYMLVMGENSKGSAYPMGEVKPMLVLRGLRCWDPRLDSTYPGGSGPCRLHDPATWVYSENPQIWAIKWGLGLWEGPSLKGAPAHGSTTDYQVGGIGAKLSGIDVPTLVAGANISDANGWTCAAYPTTDDDKSQVLDAFLQAGGAIYAQRAGKISCIHRAAPRTSIATITAADTAGPIEIDTAASRIDRINTIRPKFWSEAHRWQLTAMDDVTAEAYRIEDGGTRPRSLDYPFVTETRQTSQLAALQIAHTREGIAGIIPLKPHLQRIKPGDCFTISEPGFVLNGVKCLCLNTDFDPATKIVKVTFVSETDEKYAWAMGHNPTPPAPPVLTPVDPTFVSPPEAGDWTITPRPPSPGGGQLPGFDLGGIVSNSTATAIIVEYGPTAMGPWKQAYQGPPTVTNIPIDGVQPGAVYYIAIQYQRNQNYSDRQVWGPQTAPLLDPSPSAPTIINLQGQITTAFGDIFDVSGLVTEARNDLDALEAEVVSARGGEGSLAARVSAVNQARIDGDTANASAISGVSARTGLIEADIIDLENAQAGESLARAQSINQLTAKTTAQPNSVPNGNFETGTAKGWALPGGYLYATNPDLGGACVYAAGTVARTYPRAPAANVWSGYAATFSAQTSYQIIAGGYSQACVMHYSDAAGEVFLDQTPWQNIITDNAVRTFKVEGYAKPAAARSSRIVFSIDAATRIVLRGFVKIEAGSVCTVYTPDTATRELSASVTEHSLAIIDLENNLAGAGFRKIAEAVGGAPAYYEFFSSNTGGYAAIAAPNVALMNTSAGGPPLVALQVIGGKVHVTDKVIIGVDPAGATIQSAASGPRISISNSRIEMYDG